MLLDIAYILIGLLGSPYILFRLATSPRWRAGFLQRLGFVKRRMGLKPCIWVHAVSVGETNAVRPFLDLIAEECPEWDVRLSTSTNTGHEIACNRYGEDSCLYWPLDLSLLVRNTFRRLRPTVVVLVELEIWPNFTRRAKNARVPILVVNGRMSSRTVLPYRLFGGLFSAVKTGPLNTMCVQNETYRDRFIRAGFPESKIHVTGNMKYDAVATTINPNHLGVLREAFGIAEGDRVWVAGCTWPGEEALCLRVHAELQKTDPNLRLVLAPRHIERADAVAREITTAGYGCRRRSQGSGRTSSKDVGLLDTIGELGYVYGLADFAFVGKSLLDRGGHNMLEPAALGVPPVFGEHVENFQEEAQLLINQGAAVTVKDEAELTSALRQLLDEPELRKQRGKAARSAVLQNRGASRRHLDILRRIISEI